MDKKSTHPTSREDPDFIIISETESPDADLKPIYPTDSDISEDDDDLIVCTHCKKCFVTTEHLVSHCINWHMCDPFCFKFHRLSQYEHHNSLSIVSKAFLKLNRTFLSLCRALNIKKCGHCKEIFVCHYDLFTHANKIHRTVDAYGCVSCDMKFEMSFMVMQHVKEVHGMENIVCKACKKYIPTLGAIDTHILRCHKIPLQVDGIKDFKKKLLDDSQSKLWIRKGKRTYEVEFANKAKKKRNSPTLATSDVKKEDEYSSDTAEDNEPLMSKIILTSEVKQEI